MLPDADEVMADLDRRINAEGFWDHTLRLVVSPFEYVSMVDYWRRVTADEDWSCDVEDLGLSYKRIPVMSADYVI
jgi:hypothetical protein